MLPTRLPGEIWGVTALFNPTGSPLLYRNLTEFGAAVRRQGLRLLVVELAFGDAPFAVDAGCCDLLVRRRSDSVLWQKERLLNIGIAHLPPQCDKVVWLDGDLLFENPGWVAETARLLETYAVVQPFATACWLPERRDDLADDPPRGLGEGHALPGMAATMAGCSDRRRALSDYFAHGHLGFAWAARRDILARHGLYDRHVLGGGDVTLAHSFYGDEDFWRGRNYACRGLTKAELAAIAAWGRGIHAEIRSSVGHVPGRVLHLWHGGLGQRSYLERWSILKDNAFDPAADVALDESGCLRWASAKDDLHRRACAYFAARAARG